MSVLDAVRDLQNQTAWQKSQEAAQIRRDSVDPNINRNVGGVMGKNDFLMLLSAQLRHQDPLNPQSDGEFASQLAQFSSLEQMQNMNETLSSMASFQAYNLIGKFAIAEAYEVVNGSRQFVEISGIVDAIFSRDGKIYAQIGDFTVLVSSITDVFDGSVLLTSESLQQASNSLIGRYVKAQIGENILEGLVTGVSVEKGVMYARIDDGSGESKLVPVGSIFEINQLDASAGVKPPETQLPAPPVPEEFLVKDGDGYIELDDDGTPLRRWEWNATLETWVFVDLRDFEAERTTASAKLQPTPPETSTDKTETMVEPPETEPADKTEHGSAGGGYGDGYSGSYDGEHTGDNIDFAA